MREEAARESMAGRVAGTIGAVLGGVLVAGVLWWGAPRLWMVGRQARYFVAFLLLVPPLLAVADVVRGSARPSLGAVAWRFTFYAFRLYGLLAIQLALIPLAFLLFPAGFFLQFLGVIDLVVGLLGRRVDAEPLLCGWFAPRDGTCVPTLLLFHVGHLLLAMGVIAIGPSLFDRIAEWYAAGVRALGKRAERA